MNPQPHVLYVEDDALSRRVMQVLLQNNLGLQKVTLFENSHNFLQRISELSEKPDIVFLDIHMEPIDGFAMLAALREINAFSDVPIIALTASVMSEEVVQLRQAGFNGCIAKPIDSELFEELFQVILSGQETWRITS